MPRAPKNGSAEKMMHVELKADEIEELGHRLARRIADLEAREVLAAEERKRINEQVEAIRDDISKMAEQIRTGKKLIPAQRELDEVVKRAGAGK